MEVTRWTAGDLSGLMDKITRNAIGYDDWFDRINTLHSTTANYPPYNVAQVSNVETRLEIALAGFKKKEVFVYTEYGKLFVEGQKEDNETETKYTHKGVAQRSFTRSWTITEDWKVEDTVFEDGLLSITLRKHVPEHHARKDYL